MTEQDKLAAIRTRIDALDVQLQELINERASCAQQVAQIKVQAGETRDFYRPEREADILRRIRERNSGPLPAEEVVRLFREIMSACLALERPIQAAYLGPEGTFTQSAALKHFGHSVQLMSLNAIDEVFREVESGAAHYGVVPVENSTEGVVNHTLDQFMRSPLKITGEVELRIHHHLLGRGKQVSDVKKVCAHPQALAQCREWLDTNLPSAERIAMSSNAEAARRLQDDTTVAAIAGDAAMEIYGLNKLVANIEDEPENTTRFLVIGQQGVAASGKDKTSLLVSVSNQPGALHNLLEPLARHGISMTRIESRPSRQGVWEYVFFLDLEGHESDPAVAAAVKDLQGGSGFLKLLGSYPCAVL